MQQARVFQKSYSSLDYEIVKHFQKDFGNRGYFAAIATTTRNFSNDSSFIHLLRFDLNGNFKSQKIISWGQYTNLGGITSNEKGYIITAYWGNGIRMVMSQIDTLGNTIWEKFMGNSNYDKSAFVFTKKDASIINFVNVEGLVSPYYFVTNNSGTILNAFNINRDLDPRRFEIKKVLQVSDSSYLILCPQANTNAVPLIYIKNDKVEWAIDVNSAERRDVFDIYDISLVSDEQFQLFGNISKTTSSIPTHFFTARLNMEGQVVDAYEFPDVFSASSGAISKNKIIVGGGTILDGSAFLLQFDMSGTFKWGKKYTDGAGNYISHILDVEDKKGFLLTGRAHTANISLSGNADVLLIKTDSLGFAGCSTDSVVFQNGKPLSLRTPKISANTCSCNDNDYPSLKRISSDTICLNKLFTINAVSNGDSFSVRIPDNFSYSYTPSFLFSQNFYGSKSPLSVKFSAFFRLSG